VAKRGRKKREGILNDVLSDYVFRDELAEALGYAPSTLADWEVNATGPVNFPIGGTCLYSKRAIKTWLEEEEARKVAARERAAK